MLSPVSALALVDGKKHFREGMRFEVAEQWDKAVEEFALAVADNPKNPEFRLHLARSLFNASQMFMKKGTTSAREKDFESAYISFRRAYAYDPTNELAKSEMERMVRLQKDVLDGQGDKKDGIGKVKLVQTGFAPKGGTSAPQIPQRLEKLRDLPFPSGVDLQFIIKELARDLDLNVLFDVESFRAPRKTNIELRNVTAARALDYIFLQEGLFFQKVGPRTILIATQAQRQKFQQLVLRTFYLANASPKDVAKVVQTAIPAQPGRSQTIVLTDDATNSVTIRDTEENIRLIGKLIDSLDKDRAEVVMDVAIYEVNKTDLMQLGNQIGDNSQLTNLGGTTRGVVGLGGNTLYGTIGQTAATAIASAFGAGIVLPTSNLQAFQSRGNTKLIASTQIHAFNNEDSSARIGQRVPVQSAQYITGATNTNGSGITANVVNYEQTGLTLKFKPLVFPNQDVQVAMEIESKDVGAGGTIQNPIFTERTIKGTARIQNNKTLLLASVAQGSEINSRNGIPLLGLIPVLGRLFSTPAKNNSHVDIVIAVTPRVIRAPAILPEDEVERPTGSLAVPTNGLLEAMIMDEEQQEMLAAARRIPNTTDVQLPDQEAPVYVKSAAAAEQKAGAETATAVKADEPKSGLRPIDNSTKTLRLNQTSDTSVAPREVEIPPVFPDADEQTAERTGSVASVGLRFGGEFTQMKAGDRVKVPVIVDGSGPFSSAVLGLKFDSKKIVVRGVSFGDVFGKTLQNTAAMPFLNQNGKMYVSLIAKGEPTNSAGTLVFVEIEALTPGRPEIEFDRDVLNFMTADGKILGVKAQE
jgi:general secretion pathway protein D